MKKKKIFSYLITIELIIASLLFLASILFKLVWPAVTIWNSSGSDFAIFLELCAFICCLSAVYLIDYNTVNINLEENEIKEISENGKHDK